MIENSSGARVRLEYSVFNGMFSLAASLIWGVNTLFLLEAGLSIAEAFTANAGFALGMTLFEIPTGAVADIQGRKISFVLGVVIVLLSTAWYLAGYYLAWSVVHFFAASVLLGLGFTFYSGALEAWAVDRLIEEGAEHTSHLMFSRAGTVSAAATLIGTLGGGLLAELDLGIPYIARSLLLLVLAVSALVFMKEVRIKPPSDSDNGHHLTRQPALAAMVRITRDSFVYGWKRKEVRRIIAAGLFQGTVFMWMWYAWQPYFMGLAAEGTGPWLAGVVATSTSVAMMLGSAASTWARNLVGTEKNLLRLNYGVLCIAAALVGLAPGLALKWAGLLLLTLMFGMYNPVKQSYIHKHIPSNQRATVISFDSMIGNAGNMVGQPILGIVAGNASYSLGYIASGLFMLPGLLFLRNDKSNQEESADESKPD